MLTGLLYRLLCYLVRGCAATNTRSEAWRSRRTGGRLATASRDWTARVWESLPIDLLAATAKTRVTRELTDAERAEFGLTATSRA